MMTHKEYICSKLRYEVQRFLSKPDYSCNKIRYFYDKAMYHGEFTLAMSIQQIVDACSRRKLRTAYYYLNQLVRSRKRCP